MLGIAYTVVVRHPRTKGKVPVGVQTNRGSNGVNIVDYHDVFLRPMQVRSYLDQADVGSWLSRILASVGGSVQPPTEDMEILEIVLSSGCSYSFEVEEGATLMQTYKRCDRDRQRLVVSRASDSENPMSTLQRATLRAIFDIFDVSGNGTISSDELRLIFRVVGCKRDWRTTFAELDLNNDGSIAFEELESVALMEARQGRRHFMQEMQYSPHPI